MKTIYTPEALLELWFNRASKYKFMFFDKWNSEVVISFADKDNGSLSTVAFIDKKLHNMITSYLKPEEIIMDYGITYLGYRNSFNRQLREYFINEILKDIEGYE